MRNLTQQTPDGRTIAADPDLTRHIAQPPPRAPSRLPEVTDRADEATLVAFVSGSIAALPALPREIGPRLCLQLFLIGASEAFWTARGIKVSGVAHVLSELLQRNGLPGTETTGLIEALPQLRGDPTARWILTQGAQCMEEFLASQDRNLALQMRELIAIWRRERLCAGKTPAGGDSPSRH